LKLLAKQHLVVTGPHDKARWNYVPGLSLLQRTRFWLIARLIDAARYGDVLEIGYGSGIFLVELQQRSRRLYGVDIHPHVREVRQALAAVGVEATLFSASAEDMPLASGSVDLIVAVSTLEYVADQRRATAEMHRVLRAGGHLALVYPLPRTISDAGLRLLTGEKAEQYGDGRRTLLPVLQERFSIVRRLRFPSWLPQPLKVYEAALLERL
jgi:SAM-dependent methyltransferase